MSSWQRPWLGAFVAVIAACASTQPKVRRVCPPLAKISEARSVSLAANVILKCGTGPLAERQVLAELGNQLTGALPHLTVVDDLPSDIHVIFTLTDYVPEKFSCVMPRWHWTAAIDTFLARPDRLSAETTFVQLAEITGSSRRGTAEYARSFAQAFARTAAIPSALPPSSVRCVSDSWFPEESSKQP